MKVLQIVKTNTGAIWAYQQAIALKSMGVDIVSVMPDEFNGMAKKYKAHGIKVIGFNASLPLKKPWTFFKKKKQFCAIVKREQPNIIHSHFVTNALFVRFSLNKNFTIPRIFQVPGPLHLEKKFYRKLDILTASKKYDYWIPTCKYSYEIYNHENVDPSHLALIYYGGYGGDAVNQYVKSKNILHKEFNLENGIKLVGIISYFYKPSILKGQRRGIKGHEDFFDAMEKVIKKYNDVIAVVIGGPWKNCEKYEHSLMKYAKSKLGDRVIFTGFRNDLKDIYRELYIAVHPSHSENLGGAAESLAAGIPTISTNVGGFPDIVIDGITGYTVDKQNPTQLANAIERMIDNYTTDCEMTKKGKELVRSILDINITSNQVLEYYNRILERSRV